LAPPGNSNPPTGSVLVADTVNNRVLLYNTPVSNGQPASVVIGQPDFTSATARATASGMNNATSTKIDSQGNLWVSDWGNNRILEFKPPFLTNMNASLVIGQVDFDGNSSSGTPEGFSLPRGISFDSGGNLWVADSDNNRVLEFTPPFSTAMAASLILGKMPGYGPGSCGSIDRTLCYPTALTFDSSGNLWVVDNTNNRVVQFKPPFSSSSVPSLVIGQADMVSRVWGPGAANLNYPWGIAFDKGGNLWVSDGLNWRVLKYEPPFSSGQAASLVLGLPDFTSPSPSDLQVSISNPREIVFDSSGNLFVVDTGHCRVMVFAPPYASGMKASKVLGQNDLSSSGGTTSASGLSGPVGVSLSN
jgi:sugar lactone lactonase YvrE